MRASVFSLAPKRAILLTWTPGGYRWPLTDTPSETPPSEVTALLLEGGVGDPDTLRRIVPLVYGELRSLARRHRAGWRDEGAPGTASLVHEAYDKLVALRDVRWRSRAQFFYLASRAMRSILIDHAKHRGRAKRGGGSAPQPLDDETPGPQPAEEVLALDEALSQLSASNERLGKIVLCRVFGGLTIEETAEALSLSPASVKRGWSVARSWLHTAMQDDA